jgi:hypothetical protein
MVESVAGSVIGSQVQGVRSSVIALKVEKEQTDSTIKALDDSVRQVAQDSTSSSGRGSIVNLKV